MHVVFVTHSVEERDRTCTNMFVSIWSLLCAVKPAVRRLTAPEGFWRTSSLAVLFDIRVATCWRASEEQENRVLSSHKVQMISCPRIAAALGYGARRHRLATPFKSSGSHSDKQNVQKCHGSDCTHQTVIQLEKGEVSTHTSLKIEHAYVALP